MSPAAGENASFQTETGVEAILLESFRPGIVGVQLSFRYDIFGHPGLLEKLLVLQANSAPPIFSEQKKWYGDIDMQLARSSRVNVLVGSISPHGFEGTPACST